MKRTIRIILGMLVAGLVVAQFFQPDRNLGEIDRGVDLVNSTIVPEEVALLLKSSCYDCHSNHTKYPWYSKISPVSWFLEDHIREGKEALNFSQWASLEKNEKIGKLADICDEIDSGSMPLKSYLLIHGDAKLTLAELESLCVWTEEEGLRLLRE